MSSISKTFYYSCCHVIVLFDLTTIGTTLTDLFNMLYYLLRAKILVHPRYLGIDLQLDSSEVWLNDLFTVEVYLVDLNTYITAQRIFWKVNLMFSNSFTVHIFNHDSLITTITVTVSLEDHILFLSKNTLCFPGLFMGSEYWPPHA